MGSRVLNLSDSGGVSSLAFLIKVPTHTAELSRAQNNLQEEGELKKSHCPVYLHLGK